MTKMRKKLTNLMLTVAVILTATVQVDAILETFVNYIYWGPTGYTARVGVCPGHDISFDPSPDGAGPYITLPSANDCAERCNAAKNESDLPACVGFTYSTATRRCSLKSKSCGATVVNGSTDTSMMYDFYEGGNGCPVGFYGWNCSYYCSCANNDVCNSIDGSCPSGCSDHHWGWGCSLINTCFYDNEGGAHYKGSRYNAISGAMCQPWHQRHPHEHNLTDADMPDGSLLKARNFCRNPKPSNDSTERQPTEPWCYVLDKPDTEKETCYIKKCSCEFGRWGTNCEKECPEGRYGQDCRFTCQCAADETCSKLTGKCQKCPPGFFGTGCLRRCRCRDASEVCDYRTGACAACAEGFGGVDCYTKMPFLSQQPWVSKRSPNSLTISWQNWFQCQARGGCGEGPINGFAVEYHPRNAGKWIQNIVSSNTTQLEFTNLHDDVIYELRVRPIHSQWLQGIASTPIEFQLCGDPKSAPRDVEIVHKNCNELFCEADVSFSKIANLTELNCDASRVSYLVSVGEIKPGTEEKEPASFQTFTCPHKSDDMSTRCRMPLGRLPPGSMFAVKVCASSSKSVPSFYWKRLSENSHNADVEKKCGSQIYTTTLKTPFAEPSSPRNLTLAHVEPRRAFLEWQAPNQPNAPLTLVHYTVELRELRVRACGSGSVGLSLEPVVLQTNTTSVYLEPLKPYTDYIVTLYAQNPDQKSKKATSLRFTTEPTSPEVKLTAKISGVGTTFAQVAVDEPPCERIHGEMAGFRYEATLSQPRNGSTLLGGYSNESSFQIRNLEPYSEYLLVVHVVNHKGAGGPSSPVRFRTLETRPAEPAKPDVVNVSANSLQIAIGMAPNPRAQIRFLEVKLVDLEIMLGSTPGVISRKDAVSRTANALNMSQKDVIRVSVNNARAVSLTDLKPNTKYRIQVRAVADSGVSEWTEPIIIRTRKTNFNPSHPELEDPLAVFEDANSASALYLNSIPLIAGVIVSIISVIMIFSGVAACVVMIRRRRLSRSMIPGVGIGSSLSRSCTSGGTSSPSSSTAADDVQGRWRTIPHFLQEMKGEGVIYTTHDVLGLCDSPPTTFMPPGHPGHIIQVNTDSSSQSSNHSPSSASPDSHNSSTGAVGLLKKVPMPPPRPQVVTTTAAPSLVMANMRPTAPPVAPKPSRQLQHLRLVQHQMDSQSRF